jgi:nucleotide-binding universal stress UspA family protein
MSFKKILCAVDFSTYSRAALDLAVDLAGGGATLTLAHVVEPMIWFPEAGFDYQAVRVSLLETADKSLAEWKGDAERRSPGRSIDVMTLEGTPWERIVHFAQEGDFDLIVLGTQGRTGIRHALLGSVAERVVRHARCPVLVARK